MKGKHKEWSLKHSENSEIEQEFKINKASISKTSTKVDGNYYSFV